MGDRPRQISGGSDSHLLSRMAMREVLDPDDGPCIEMDLHPHVTNPHGGLHGGLLCTLIECGAAGCAVRETASTNIVAVDLSVRFLAPARVGPARVLATPLRVGSRSVVVQADVMDMGADRALVARATVAYARLADPSG